MSFSVSIMRDGNVFFQAEDIVGKTVTHALKPGDEEVGLSIFKTLLLAYFMHHQVPDFMEVDKDTDVGVLMYQITDYLQEEIEEDESFYCALKDAVNEYQDQLSETSETSEASASEEPSDANEGWKE